jgi:exopolysaccharide biosynthesis WecB/TagA/CpsF family protein
MVLSRPAFWTSATNRAIPAREPERRLVGPLPAGAAAAFSPYVTFVNSVPASNMPTAPVHEVVHEFDTFDLASFAAEAARFGQDRYGYVVTPNVDHLVRYHEDAGFRACYQDATYVLLDSRVAAPLIRILKGVRVPVCPGSDLTLALLAQRAESPDRIVFIGGSAEQSAAIAARFRLSNVRHHNPPLGFITDPDAVERCLEFIEAASPFRFCFLAVGSPQQEALARMLGARGKARGLALCVGAALNFLTGAEKRAPLWMQRSALEWLYRLTQDPRRMSGRYLIRGPRVILYLAKSRVVLRPAAPDRPLRPRP